MAQNGSGPLYMSAKKKKKTQIDVFIQTGCASICLHRLTSDMKEKTKSRIQYHQKVLIFFSGDSPL
ncbi:hypothetical protein HanIR_Chr16g0795171 [Helianthus annuus]|nr:hypothetical protein HanIR_Chr16g0795171 [Helianthus annuus]